ncbi:MAG: hypothetical protein KDI03_20610, partial [Anaerolineae bacterium]|nr:hypothetical protein [Anaerolineae bacterium]
STNVRFVDPAGGTINNIDHGFNNPIDYSQSNPPLVTAQTAFGPRNPVTAGPASAEEPGLPTFTVGGSDNANQSVISIGYTSDGDLSPTNQHSTFATLKQTGTLYGMIYQRQAQLVLAGTYFKSYADTGPIQTSGWLQNVDPMGAIYAVTPAALAGEPANNNNARVYANLNKIKDPTSVDPFIPGNPAGVDPRRTGGINYDINDCNGPNGTPPQAYPATNLSCWRHDPVAFDNVGSIALGDLEEDDTESFIFVTNLKDKKLYQLPIDSNPANWPIQTLAAPPVAIPNNCAVSADAVPGGLGFNDGKLYVGVTCTAKSTQDPDQLKAEVWRFDPVSQTFGGSPVFSLNLGYPRGCIYADNSSINQDKNVAVSGSTSRTNCQNYSGGDPNTFDNANWLPWPQNWQQAFSGNQGVNSPGRPGHTNLDFIQLEYPNPWLSDITFDGNDLVLGFRDINGDHTGNAVRSPNISTNTGFPTQNYVLDNFNAQSYSNNNGNVNWSSNWTETNDGGTNPTSGSIQVATNVSNYQLRLQGSGSVKSVQRSFSSGTLATIGGAAVLSFAYRRVGLETGDSVAVQISTDGGANYTTVMSINGPSTDPTYRTAILPLSGLTTNSAIRFQTNAAMDSNDLVWIDNVRISNATTSWMANYT